MKVALDVTSLLDPATGVGTFTGEVAGRLAARPGIDLVGFAATWRGRDRVGGLLAPPARTVRRPMAARPLRFLWRRTDHPAIERWTGRVDVVHGPNFVVPPASGAAEVVTVHDLTCLRFPELVTRDVAAYPALIGRAVARGAWVHAVSEAVADEVRSAFPVPADRVVVVPNGATALPPDGPATGAVAGRRLAGADRYLLALGTVEPRKDLPTLVRAFDRLAGDRTDLRLVVAGGDGWGGAVDDLAAAVVAAEHGERVVRLGRVSDADRAALLRGAAAFAYPSRYEGFGLPPLEAMAAGTPVVATSVGALPEVVGDAGRLVPAGDPVALAEALAGVLDDDGERQRLVEAGRANLARFDWDRTVDGLVDLYRRAVR